MAMYISKDWEWMANNIRKSDQQGLEMQSRISTYSSYELLNACETTASSREKRGIAATPFDYFMEVKTNETYRGSRRNQRERERDVCLVCLYKSEFRTPCI